jgi:hypothetical protein
MGGLATFNPVTTGPMDSYALDLVMEEINDVLRAAQDQNHHFDPLAAHIRTCFAEAQRHREASGLKTRMLDCQRRRKGEYDDDEKAAIAAVGGCQRYFKLTSGKCLAAESWLTDTIRPADDKPYGLQPTPLPTLPEDLMGRLESVTVLWYREQEALGVTPTPQEVQHFALDLGNEMLGEARARAKKATQAHERLIDDQLAEGDWDIALAEFIRNVTTFPFAVLKGPILETRMRLVWRDGAPAVVTEAKPVFRAPSPHDVYFAPNARDVNQGYILEVLHLSPTELASYRGVEGYSTEAIDAVLAEGVDALQPVTMLGEGERNLLEEREALPTANVQGGGGTIEAVEFWGPVQGQMLSEWGMATVQDPLAFYEVCALLVGDYCVRAVLNPDPMGRRPYNVCSFVPVAGSIIGEGIPEQMDSEQDDYNAVSRALINNAAACSKPCQAVDISVVDAKANDVRNFVPGKTYTYNGKAIAAGRRPVEFFEVPNNIQQLLALRSEIQSAADNATQIPRYVTGNQDVGGAAETATGLRSLMDAAAKGIKRLIGEMDAKIVRPAIHLLYVYNLFNHPDKSIRGDAQVIARGVLATLQRAHTQQLAVEFMAQTNNPTDMQLLGMKGRLVLLRRVADALDIDKDELLPTVEELQQQMQDTQALQGAMGPMDMEQEAMA